MMRGACWLTANLLSATALASEPAPNPAPLVSPIDVNDITELSLADLLNSETTVATGTVVGVRETPGIVTILTRDQILATGARDLIDVLRSVPGFDFGVDVQGTVGLGVRGNWAQEGKHLLLIDGHEMNEMAYTTVAYGNHFPVEHIERIEIIRGPGSAIYGGYAELAVINVITMAGATDTGFQASGTYGQLAKTHGRRYLGASWAGDLGRDVRLATLAYYGQGTRSNEDYVDLWGDSYDMAPSSALNPGFGAVDLQAGALTTRLQLDWFRTTQRDSFDEISRFDVQTEFHQISGLARYEGVVSDQLTITPYLSSRWVRSYFGQRDMAPTNYNWYISQHRRDRVGLQVNVTPNDWLDILMGAEDTHDFTRAPEPTLPANFALTGKRSSHFNAVAGYAQALAFTSVANFTLGARAENHATSGAAFVPRMAVTRAWDKSHVKLLASQAFRAPGIEQLEDGDITPESATIVELEVGAGVGDHVYITANGYNQAIRNPIVYFYDYDEIADQEYEGYRNHALTGTNGAEVEMRYKTDRAWVTASYAVYQKAYDQTPPYRVHDAPRALLGFSNHKVAWTSAVNPAGRLWISPSGFVLGPRWAETTADADDVGVQELLPSSAVVNLFVQMRDLGTDGLDVGVGVFDLIDANPPFVQPYNALHAPLPGTGREFTLRATLAR